MLGAGIVGVACALHLLRDGHRVTLIDRLAPGEGCSYGNAGVLASYACLPLARPELLRKLPRMVLDARGPISVRWSRLPALLPWLVRFVRAGSAERAAASARALAALVGGSVEEYQTLTGNGAAAALIRRAPVLYVYRDQRALDADASVWETRRRHGVRFHRTGDAELRALEPALSPAFTRAMVIEGCGYTTDPSRLVKLLAEQAIAQGAQVLEREVRDVHVERDGVRLRCDGEDLSCERLVVAAGAWSGWIARRLGDPVPLEAERGYHVTIRDAGVALGASIGSAEGGFFATPMDAGIRVAGTSELDALDAPPDYRRADRLLERAREMFPGIDTHEHTRWMGQRPTLPDSLPVIGPSSRHASVYYAFGHQHVGLTTAPRTGRIVADLVSERRANTDLEPYRVDRFGA